MTSSTNELLAVSQLSIDPDLQRPLVDNNYAKIRKDYDPNALGQLIVSQRPNGDYIVLDGYHRFTVVSEVDPSRKLSCLVFRGLTPVEEAELFLKYNAQSAVSPTAKFRLAVLAGRPIAVAVNQILTDNKVELGNSTKRLSAVTDVVEVAAWEQGLELLGWALVVIRSAWLADPDFLENKHLNRAFRGEIIKALARIRYRYGSEIDTNRLIAALRTQGGRGPMTLHQRATALASTMGRVSKDAAMARVITEIYSDYKVGGRKPLVAWDFDPRRDAKLMRRSSGIDEMLATALPVADATVNRDKTPDTEEFDF